MQAQRHDQFGCRRATPKHPDVRRIADNYATHKIKDVKDWLAKRKRFHFRFIPRSSSWLNLAERWFGAIPNERVAAAFAKAWENASAPSTPPSSPTMPTQSLIVWTKSRNDIILKVNRGRAALPMPRLARKP